MFRRQWLSFIAFALLAIPVCGQSLPGTKPLPKGVDWAEKMVAGMEKYLDRKIAESVKSRRQYWKSDFSSPAAYAKSVEPNRKRFAEIIGLVDVRVSPVKMEYVGGPDAPSLTGKGSDYEIHKVRWPVLPGVDGEGLLWKPKGPPTAFVIAVPDAAVSKGRTDPLLSQTRYAAQLADRGCMVLVPSVIDRSDQYSGDPALRMTNQPHREFVYRMAFEMGRHIIGYEVQKVMAAVDWFQQFSKTQKLPAEVPIAVTGFGEGGLIAFYSGAVDQRIDVVGVSGYFRKRENLWKEPIYRNVWGLLREFGDAEIAALIAPRTLLIEESPEPKVEGPPPVRNGRRGAAPGALPPTEKSNAFEEFQRAKKIAYDPLKASKNIRFHKSDAYGSHGWVRDLQLALKSFPDPQGTVPPQIKHASSMDYVANRQKHQFQQLVDFTQRQLPESRKARDKFFWSTLDTKNVAAFQKSVRKHRDYFWDEVIGKLPKATMPMNVRTRLAYVTPKWKGYEVVMDLYEDVICYGVLLVPNDIKPGERRPVVVCQHGLEGRPEDVVNPKEKTRAYNSFGAALANQGYIVFAPQNPYIFRDRFRQVVRRANSVKLTLYSFIVRQHERILEWLATLPFVDASRIAYYGLSYGGKVAMRIPALLDGYCLVICSGDFNEWIWKNITLDWRNSYMFTGEYEMYEWNLGNTFNYAEMAALIAPRPFMVERGHHDGVGLDHWVAFEYARVRYFYVQLGVGDRTEIEFFNGRHEINGVGTYRFLAKHLRWREK